MEPLKRVVRPNIKEFTIAQLREIEVPEFQRWINLINKEELRESINEVGMLRCPVICYVKGTNITYIIDGNHMLRIVLEEKSYRDDDLIPCIYNEVDTESDAAMQFQLLNTKGKKLDWTDITNLYRHVHGTNSLYQDIWVMFFKNPSKLEDVEKYKGFTIPTIIEFLVGDKNKYRNGEYMPAIRPRDYSPRRSLLYFLVNNANESWEALFPFGKRPTGAAILGFANLWFTNKLHARFQEKAFITMINNIYQYYQKPLNDGTMIINRDNAGNLLKEYLNENYKDLTLF